jgi:hypothetical protein
LNDQGNWTRSLSGGLYERWPKDASGEPEEPALLTTAINLNLVDELTVNMLEAYGIPCLKRYPGNGSFGKIILGMSGQGTEIYVPKSMLEDAVALVSGEAREDE